MGWAKDHLSEGRRREIASSLFEVTGRDSERGEMIGRCPAAGHDDSNASFSYNPSKDLANCLGCDFKGDLVDIFSETKGLDKKAGFKAFKAEFGGGVEDRPRRASGGKAAGKSKAAPVIDEAIWTDPDKFEPLPEEWVERLVDRRGWSREVIERFDLKLGRQRKGGKRRICIPVRDSAGKLRNIRFYLPGGEPKIKSFAKGYGGSRFWPPKKAWAEGPVWLVEGEPDALCGLSRGINAVTSTTGAKSLPKDAATRLKGRDIVICYDADRAGVEGAERAVKRLGPRARSIRVVQWPPEMGLLENGEWPDKHGLDLTDWFMDLGRSVEELEDLAEEVRVPKEAAATNDGERFYVRAADGRYAFRPALLARELMDDNRYLHDSATGLTYQWGGMIWDEITPARIEAAAAEKLGLLQSRNKLSEAAHLVTIHSQLQPGDELDPDPDLICLRNGMFRLSDGAILPHKPEYRASRLLDIDFDPARPAPCDRWIQFLAETVQDKTVARELQEFFGYALTREVRYETALFLVGPGGDGKSTCLGVLEALVGPDNCSSVAFEALEDQFQRVALYRRQLNISTEITSGAIQSQFFKAIVSGDPIRASFKHKDGFEFRPYCKLAFSGNTFPKVLDNSDALWDRLLMIEFRRQFRGKGEADPFLIDKLRGELPGVFGWAWEGLKRLRERGRFDQGKATTAYKDRFRRLNDPVLEFIQERCTTAEQFGRPATVEKAALFKDYKEFCGLCNYGPLGRERFFEAIKRHLPGLKDVRPRLDGKRIRSIEGIRLAGEADDGAY